MLEEQTLSGGNTTLGTKKLQQLVSGDKGAEEDDDNQNLIVYDSEEEQAAKFYSFLWISEKYFLEGMCQFLLINQDSQQRSYL